MNDNHFDSIVIGGGSGGIAYATGAAKLGARVLLIERGKLGGTCVNRGCVPKKLMWETANMMADGKTAAASQILAHPPQIDFARLQSRIDAKISDIHTSYRDSFNDVGVTLMSDEATVLSATEIRVGTTQYHCDHLVIATGATPMLPDFDGADLADTSDTFFEWDTLPNSVVILGGGYIGCEFASILAAFGVSITLVDNADRILSVFDEDIADAAQTCLKKRGINIRLDQTTTAIRKRDSGFAVETESGESLYADRVIAATGRQPNIASLGAFAKTLRTVESGALDIDARFQTSVAGVYAIGDVANRLPLTPVATRDGDSLAHILFGEGATQIDLRHVASAAYLIPPVAQVGAPDANDDAKLGAPLSEGVLVCDEGGRAHTLHKMSFDNGHLNGVALMAADAPELIGLFAALTATGASQSDLRIGTAVHPTFAEELVGRN